MATIDINSGSSLTQNMSLNQSANSKAMIQDYTPIHWLALVLFIGILLLNIIVIVLLMRRKKKSRMAFFVQNLALSDICVGLFYLLPQLMFRYFVLVTWDSPMCFAYGYLHMTAFHVSTFAIVVLTLDRLFAIQYPLSTKSKTRTYRYVLAITTWTLGALASVPYASNYKVIGHDCSNMYLYMQVELWVTSSLLIFIPVVVIVICYSIMIRRIQHRNNEFFTLQDKGDPQSQRQQVMISKTKIRTIKLLLIVVIVYIVCWGPIFICSILEIYGFVTDQSWISTGSVLAPLNSLTNPLIFLIFNRKIFLKKKETEHALKTKRLVRDGHHPVTVTSNAV